MHKSSRIIRFTLKFVMILISSIAITGSTIFADEVKFLCIGMLHSWFSSTGCEIEVGRRHLISDQQDGFDWPAIYELQDNQAARGLWIGAKNYNDPIALKTLQYKVVHTGPRGLDEQNEFMPQEFKLIGKFNHPTVVVDDVLASQTVFNDVVDEIDENMPADRMIYNVVNTELGITFTRKINAFSSPEFDDFFIYDFVFKNTGTYDLAGNKHSQTLEDVIFFFQYRWAVSKYIAANGYYWAPQQVTWGQSTVNEVLHPFYGDDIRASYAWLGLHSKYEGDNIGGPNIGSPTIAANGFLGGTQFPGVITLHVDHAPNDQSDDPNQPSSAPYFFSGHAITQPNNQFDPGRMTEEYLIMSSGMPSLTHAEAVGDGNADELPIAGGGGVSQAIGYGPYTLAPGDSIHIIIGECIGGLNWEKRKTLGRQWFDESSPYNLPGGGTTTDRNEFKDTWVFTGRDSIMKAFARVQQTYENGLIVDPAPPPPQTFTVTSGGDRITLTWADNAETYAHFAGYKLYRSMDTPDTSFTLLYECGQGTGNPLTHQYDDRGAARGFDYYYYITSFDDGSVNTIKPGTTIESNLFWTRTTEPAYLRRMPGEKLSDIRIVPNPYHIGAKDYQFGSANKDRLMFYNLPPLCTIKIFTERGDLIETIEHADGSGDEEWRSVTSSRQVIVSGLYIVYFETPDGESISKKLIVVR